MNETTVCACCGAPTSAKGLRLDAEFRVANFGGRSVALGSLQFRLLEAIHAALPRPARSQWLAETTGIATDSVRPMITRLRRNIAPLGLCIIAPRHVGSTRDADDEPGCFYLLEAAPLDGAAAPVTNYRKAAPPARRARLVCVS